MNILQDIKNMSENERTNLLFETISGMSGINPNDIPLEHAIEILAMVGTSNKDKELEEEYKKIQRLKKLNQLGD